MTMAQWRREENIRRYMGYTPEEREAARAAAEEAARTAEKKREELGLELFGEPPESLITLEQSFKEVMESSILASLKDFESRMVAEIMGGGGWGGGYAEEPEAARERVEMILSGKLAPEGISPKLLEEYNKFIEEEYKPWLEEEYKPAEEAYGKELMRYYKIEGEYAPEKIAEVQRKIKELEPFQEEAGRKYEEYVGVMGVALPMMGETEKQTLQRLRGEFEWYRGVVGERRGLAEMGKPEMMDIRYLEEARRTLTETEKELGKITGALEPLEAYYYQQYGRPLTSELLAEAPGRLALPELPEELALEKRLGLPPPNSGHTDTGLGRGASGGHLGGDVEARRAANRAGRGVGARAKIPHICDANNRVGASGGGLGRARNKDSIGRSRWCRRVWP